MLLVDHHYVPSRSRSLTLGMTTSRAAPGLEAAAAWSNHTSASTLSFVSPLMSISEVPDERSLMAAARFIRAAPLVAPWRLTWRTLPSQSRYRVYRGDRSSHLDQTDSTACGW